MRAARVLGASLLTCSLMIAGSVSAPQPRAQEQFEPQVGQEGKDVIWVPTPSALVDKMLDMVRLTPQDRLLDLGSGDGRTVIAAAKRGARALGIEYNPAMVELSRSNAAKAGLKNKARFVKADLFQADLSRATVISMFLLPELNLRLRPRILALKPGTRVVSNTFTMGDWLADETATVAEGCSRWCTALLWIVPAKVEGTWLSSRGEFRFKQEYQLISGTVTSASDSAVIASGLLRGDGINFNVREARYTGRVIGNVIEGSVSFGGTVEEWKALRAGP
jgi:SAM-dependent methyltransferase